MHRFLIDECLTPKLAARARVRGYEAHHVTQLDRTGFADYRIVDLALDRDFVVATNNARDYLRLYSRVEVHGGLVILIPSVRGADQGRLFDAALDYLEGIPDLVNKVIEVHAVDDVRVSNLPPEGD